MAIIPRPALLAAVLLAAGAPLAAQAGGLDGAGAPPGRCPAPVLVSSPAHWLPSAVRRIELAGPHELATAGTGTLPLASAVRALEAAAGAGETPAVRRAAAAYLHLLEAAEHPALAGPAGAGCGFRLDARAEAGYAGWRGLVRPARGYNPPVRTEAFPVPSLSSPAAGGTAAAAWGRLGARVELLAYADSVELPDAHVAADLGDVVVWAGRRAIHYGPGRGGGLVLGGAKGVTGVGAVVTDPLRLPWFLARLGPIGIESFFSKARGGEIIVDPWFWGARITTTPHPRFRIGASRGTMFGGEGNTPVTVRYALQMVMGMHSGIGGEFDNHFGSVDLRWRPPWLPLDLYLEWALNDSAGAWWAIPARLVGVHWSALPFAPGVGLNLELAHVPRSCCGNPEWYRNWAFDMNWTHEGEAIAHPLGGHGHEISLRVDAVLDRGAAVGHARAFQRRRGEENLFHPQWAGRSLGAEAALRLRPGPGAGALLRGYIEAGDGWRAGRLFTGLTWGF